MVNISLRNFIMIGIIAMLFSVVMKVVTVKYRIPVLSEIVGAS